VGVATKEQGVGHRHLLGRGHPGAVLPAPGP
jgi:hypothetical protein